VGTILPGSWSTQNGYVQCRNIPGFKGHPPLLSFRY
jgi:hypothetical protein